MAILVKFVFAFAGVLCLGTISEARDAANNGGHPIEKVITLLKGFKGDVIAEGKRDAVLYEKFTLWCSTSIRELQGAISDEKEQISELTDTKNGRNKDDETLSQELQELEQQIADMDASGLSAKEQSDWDRGNYSDKMDNLESTIAGVDKCIEAMTGANQETEGAPKAMMLAQMHVKRMLWRLGGLVSKNQMSKLQAFAGQDPDDAEPSRESIRAKKKASRPDQLAAGDHSAHKDKYDFKSENVIELLKQLKTKFEDDKLAAVKAETNSQNAYNLALKARDNAIEAAQNSHKKKTDEKGRVQSILADTEESLKNLNEDLTEDSKTRDDTKEECAEKASEWNKRSHVRDLEVKAMDAAVNILSEASGVRTKPPQNPGMPGSPVFLQVDSDNPKMAAVAVLHEVAQTTHSRAMERLAVEVQAHLSGPFDQVNNMIEKMIFRLMDEQKQEDEHKLWCDHELEKTRVMKEAKESKVTDLDTTIQVEKSKVSELTIKIVEANDMIADIVKFMTEATEIRGTGKTENRLAIKDAEAAQKALQNAVAVLTTFYKSSGEIPKEPWEFIQAPHERDVVARDPKTPNLGKNPDTWENAEYAGVKDAQGRIISVLEGVMTEFATMEAETKSQEAQDQKEYDQTMSDHKIQKTRRTKETEMLAIEKKRRAHKITELESHKKNTNNELDSTNQYLKDLYPACEGDVDRKSSQKTRSDGDVEGDRDGKSSYEKRVAARDMEIKALRKAQVILTDHTNPNRFDKKESFLGIKRYGDHA